MAGTRAGFLLVSSVFLLLGYGFFYILTVNFFQTIMLTIQQFTGASNAVVTCIMLMFQYLPLGLIITYIINGLVEMQHMD